MNTLLIFFSTLVHMGAMVWGFYFQYRQKKRLKEMKNVSAFNCEAASKVFGIDRFQLKLSFSM